MFIGFGKLGARPGPGFTMKKKGMVVIPAHLEIPLNPPLQRGTLTPPLEKGGLGGIFILREHPRRGWGVSSSGL